MRTQASSIIACDLFTVESIRLKTLHVLFFIELHRPTVLIGGMTDGPANLAWCTQIARNLSKARENQSEPIRFLVHDRDKRFAAHFDEVFRAEGIEIIRTPWRAPKGNVYAERWIPPSGRRASIASWCLALVTSRKLLSTYVKHYKEERGTAASD